MRVLLTGATGYIGAAVVQALRNARHDITAVVRSEESGQRLAGSGGIDAFVVAPLEQPDLIGRHAAEADGVIHLAFDHAMQRQPGLSIAEALGGAVAKEIAVIDAICAALASTGKPFVGSSACGILGDTRAATPVDESYPSPPDFPPAMRRRAEDAITRAAGLGIRSSVVRPALMTHSDGPGGPVPRLVQVARDNGFAGYIGAGENRLSAVSLQDLAELYVLALEKAPAGAIYNGAGTDIASRDIAAAISAALGAIGTRSVAPEEAIGLWGPFAATLLAINNRCSSARAVRELGWRPYATAASIGADLAKLYRKED